MQHVWVDRRDLLVATAAAGVATMTALPSTTRAAGTNQAAPWRDRKKFVNVFGLPMAYFEIGSGPPIVFLHGNPSSSYEWRNIIPHVQKLGRCIAPDLIGMGDSAKLPNSGPGVYAYKAHRKYVFELLRQLGVEQGIVFVVHDWGSALGFDFTSQRPEAVRGIAYMEAILRIPSNNRLPQRTGSPLDRYRSPEGEHLILDENVFVEHQLIDSLQYYLTEEDKAEYRRPYLQAGESRRPTLEWPRQLPAWNQENDVIVKRYSAWLMGSAHLPKLFVHAVPGAIFRNEELLAFAQSFLHQKEVTVYGPHFVQEVSPHAIGRALAEWAVTV